MKSVEQSYWNNQEGLDKEKTELGEILGTLMEVIMENNGKPYTLISKHDSDFVSTFTTQHSELSGSFNKLTAKDNNTVQQAHQFNEGINSGVADLISKLNQAFLSPYSLKKIELNKLIKEFKSSVKKFKNITDPHTLESKASELKNLTEKLENMLKCFPYEENDSLKTETQEKLKNLIEQIISDLNTTYKKAFKDSTTDRTYRMKQNLTFKVADQDHMKQQPSSKLMDAIQDLYFEINPETDKPIKRYTSNKKEASIPKYVTAIKSSLQFGEEIKEPVVNLTSSVGSLMKEFAEKLWEKNKKDAQIKIRARQFDKTMKNAFDYLTSTAASVYNTIVPSVSTIKMPPVGETLTKEFMNVSNSFNEWLSKKITNIHDKVNQKQLEQFIINESKNLSKTTSSTYSYKWIIPKQSFYELTRTSQDIFENTSSYQRHDVYNIEYFSSIPEISYSVEDISYPMVEITQESIVNIQEDTNIYQNKDFKFEPNTVNISFDSTPQPETKTNFSISINVQLPTTSNQDCGTTTDCICWHAKNNDASWTEFDCDKWCKNLETTPEKPIHKNNKPKRKRKPGKYRSDPYYSKINAAILARQFM